MNICELLLSAFGIWHVESEDAKNRPLCFLTSEFLASITVSPHIRRKHQTTIWWTSQKLCCCPAVTVNQAVMSVEYWKSIQLWRSCRPFDREIWWKSLAKMTRIEHFKFTLCKIKEKKLALTFDDMIMTWPCFLLKSLKKSSLGC